MPECEITKDEFDAFNRVRDSGKYNMVVEADAAAAEAGLSRDKWFDIIKNYSELWDKYSNH